MRESASELKNPRTEAAAFFRLMGMMFFFFVFFLTLRFLVIACVDVEIINQSNN